MTEPDWLDAALAAAGLDTVDGAFAYGGGVDMVKPLLGSRRRTRIRLADPQGGARAVYLKRYGPGTLVARLRWACTHGLSRGPAAVERDNIDRARAAGLPTMQVLRFGEGRAAGGYRGYLVVSAVPGEALERCAKAYLAGGGPAAGAALTGKLAELVAALHLAGYVHRDLYASHVFLSESPAGPELHLIDLARMFAPRWRAFRWRVKDLAQLKYSMPGSWLAPHWDAFLHRYVERTGWGPADRYNRAVDRKVGEIARRSARTWGRPSPKGSA